MNYVILNKETEEMVDVIDLSPKDKLKFEKEHPEWELTEATEEELIIFTNLDEYDDDDGNWEDDEDC